MNVYLAAPITNISLFIKERSLINAYIFFLKCMNIFLSSVHTRSEILDFIKKNKEKLNKINILESFYYVRKCEDFMPLIKNFGSFMLDSGAFTFLNGSYKGEINWDKYVEEYASFINRHNVKLFFELDIDSVVGLQEVERLRNKLENITGRKPIPVWHKKRGKEYFIKMCKNYPYVAIGGIVTKEIPKKEYESGFKWFIKEAHRNGAKIHALGYTNISNLKIYHFDSVDSSSWLRGNIGGFIYRFNPNTVLMEQRKREGMRLKTKEGAINNIKEWIRFCLYAKSHL